MKIRQGFVSNSSSSSFICDTKLSRSEIKEQLQKILAFSKELFSDSTSDYLKEQLDLPYSEIFGSIGKVTKKYLKDISFFLSEYTDEEKEKYFLGKTYIHSAHDNSIPYELWDLICSKFNAQRIHLG